ncbi:MAG: type I restriction endonuclease subunit R [Oceanospirillaceae bacterium]|nr:type I restriction endonuclease subunit R [Oceanospirillaceae bacterium]
MTKKYTELRFEEWIQESLVVNGYHLSFTHSGEEESLYDKDLCLLPQSTINFIKRTQPEEYDKLHLQFDESTDDHILKTINKTIEQRGIIDTLRGGIDTRGCSFDLVYFKPKSSLNKDHQALYESNRFICVRQLHYSKRNNNSIDMVLFLNGIPLVTMELKNQLTGQNIIHSQNQYKKDRDPREPLLKFKRCLVHFCVDNDKVSMTTQLRGERTKFLPYNKGITNPVVKDDFRTEYLWNEVLLPDSLLDIIENFVLISEETDKEWDDKKGKVVTKKFDVQIFPRYHQLDVIRSLRDKVVEEGPGHNYLVQHTTGSGKSYSIGWLSHALTSLYKSEHDTKRIFDTILVITDRKVLDRQLQNTVSKLEQTSGVVNPVDINSAQLKEYLEKGKDIIITTIQKFPFVSEVISELKGNTFAVVIDEVHSSQTGETSKHLKKSLSASEDEEGEDLEEMIRQEIEARGKQTHISFFGFTGTPKNKTLELFGRKNEDGHFVPFHSYSMQQSITEGFTLDVLQNYTTFKRYFKMKTKAGKEDEEVPESKVKSAIVNYVDSHEKTISDKVGIILDHFVSKTSKKINGRARGMVVVRSRKHCVLFHEEMVKQMKAKNLPYSCLVAFSGSIHHNGQENTESSLNTANGLEPRTGIPDGLKDPKFRILIVSNKFQTGFDEPLLQSMYIDKKLSNVQCVQTLSRLNRTTRGKTDTFILDFANETDEIIEAFQPYFTSTILKEETDPDKLYDLLYEIEQFNLYTQMQLDEFCKEFYSDSDSDARLHPIIDVVVDAFNESLTEEQQDDFKSKIQSFIRLYSYISQISGFAEVKWEKSYAFLRFLNKKLPKKESEKVSITEAVDLDSLRIQLIGESNLSLVEEQGEVYGIDGSSGGGKDEEPKVLLAEVIEKINTVFGANLGEEDRVTLELIQTRLNDNAELKKVINGNNSEDAKKDYFKSLFGDTVVDYHGDRIDFYKNVMDNKVFPMLVEFMYEQVVRNAGRNG